MQHDRRRIASELLLAKQTGGPPVKRWSPAQRTAVTSRGEADYYAVARRAAEALGLVAATRDLGGELKLQAEVDSSAAKAVVGCVGLGRARHTEALSLWPHEEHSNGASKHVR